MKLTLRRPSPGLLVLVLAAVSVLPGWAEGSDSATLASQGSNNTLYLAQVGAGVVEQPLGQWPTPSQVCGNGGHLPSDVGWTGPRPSSAYGVSTPWPAAYGYTSSYVWLFGPGTATYNAGNTSDPNWAYEWGEQQAVGAYWQRWYGGWAGDMSGMTLFADVETGGNQMCGSWRPSSGWWTDGSTNSHQQNTNVIQGFLYMAGALEGHPAGAYWNPSTFNQITAIPIWPNQPNYYVYWQAGGCAPITSNCHFTTIHAGNGASQAEGQYNAYRCSENIDTNNDDRMVIWQYDVGGPYGYDFDVSAQETWAPDYWTPSLNGC